MTLFETWNRWRPRWNTFSLLNLMPNPLRSSSGSSTLLSSLAIEVPPALLRVKLFAVEGRRVLSRAEEGMRGPRTNTASRDGSTEDLRRPNCEEATALRMKERCELLSPS